MTIQRIGFAQRDNNDGLGFAPFDGALGDVQISHGHFIARSKVGARHLQFLVGHDIEAPLDEALGDLQVPLGSFFCSRRNRLWIRNGEGARRLERAGGKRESAGGHEKLGAVPAEKGLGWAVMLLAKWEEAVANFDFCIKIPKWMRYDV